MTTNYTDEYLEAYDRKKAGRSSAAAYTDEFLEAFDKRKAEKEAQKQAEYEASRPINKIKNLVSGVANNLNQNVKSTQPPLINNQNQTLETPENQQSSLIKNTQSFEEKHPLVNSIPEASKQFALRAVKSYPTYAMGLNDLLAVIGDKTNNQNLSDFGKSNYEFWKEQSDKIPVDEKYQGLKGLSDKNTVLPTIAGSLGDQTTNIINALGGGSLGGSVAAKLGLNGLLKAGAITAGSSIPNIAQEGSYLDKIEAFEQIYGRKPTEEELKNIQNVSLTEKGINTALETAADRLLFNKLFPASVGKKNVQKILKDTLQQAATEAGTELGQETTSIGAEKILGINQGNNLQRLLDTLAISGITGGVTGGVSSVMSRQYDTQFPEAEKNVSAKIVNNGKVIYDSSNNTAFDALKQLSKNGSLKNNTERLAENQRPQKQTSENLVNTENKTVEYPPALRDNNGFIITENNPLVTAEKPTQPQNKVEYYPAVYEQENNTNENIAENENISDNKEEVFDAGRYINQTAQTKQYGSVTREQMSAMKQYRASLKTDIENLKEPKSEYEYIKSKYNGKVYSHYIYNYGDEQQRANDEFNIIIEDIKRYARTNITSIPDNVIKLWEMQMESAYHVWYDGDTADQEVKYDKFYTALNKVWEYHICNEVIDNTTIKGKRNGNEQRTTKTVERNIPQEPEQIPDDIGNDTERRNEGMDNQGNDEKYETVSGTGVVETEQNANGITRNLPEIENKQQDTEQLRNVLKNDLGFQDTDKVIDTLLSDGKENPDFSVAYVNTIKSRLREHDQNAYKQFSDLYENYLKKRKENKNAKNNAVTVEKSPEISDNENKEVLNENTTRDIARSAGLQEELPDGLQTHTNMQYDGRSDSGNDNQVRTEDWAGNASGNLGTADTTLEEHKILLNKKYKNAHELNEEIAKFINNKEYEKYKTLPEEIKEWLKKFTGAGGKGNQGATGVGTLSEYYTPKNIVKKMWDLTSQYIKTDGSKVLEPSVGIGRFLEFAPENITVDAHEINPVSAKITELLYPNTNVTLGEFQKRFIDKTKNRPIKNVNPEYDIVIGNPPYGKNSGESLGIGEGKGITRLEAYFIKRGIDLLNDNGILTFIVPSTFLDAKDASTSGVRLAVSQKAELLDAYRLPEKTFDSTSIGTDIIVMRKNSGEKTNRDWIQPGNWFEQHPEKILGEVKTRKNQYGKEEKYVTGDKNSADKINTSNTDIRETKKSETKTPKTKDLTEKKTTNKQQDKKQTQNNENQKIEYETYKLDSNLTDEEKAIYRDTKVDGSLPDTYKPGKNINQFKGKLYNDFNYLQGDLYEKLDQIEHEDISEEQKAIQKEKIEKVLPPKIKIEKMDITPTGDFIDDLNLLVDNPYYNNSRWIRKEDKIKLEETEKISLVQGAIQYLYGEEVKNDSLKTKDGHFIDITKENIRKYFEGNSRFNYSVEYPADDKCTKNQLVEKNSYKAQVRSDIREVANRLFVEYLSTLPNETKDIIEDRFNREFNNFRVPDYKKMPLLLDDLSATFRNGSKLKLRNEQIEGINFLLNKGVGLLGFDTGVGKTLTSIVSAYQNIKNGKCKRPLMVVQAVNQSKWKDEINALYPNVKVNFLDNLGASSKFDGIIEDGSITLVPYESFDNIWFKDETIKELQDALSKMKDTHTTGREEFEAIQKQIKGNKFRSKDTARENAKFEEDIKRLIGEAKAGNSAKFLFEDLGFDYITVDEAQYFKSLFTSAKAYNEKQGFKIESSKNPTKSAIRLFLMTQYILKNNANRNVVLLSATPFTNNPTEVFSIFSYIGKDLLDKMHCYNVHQFMENFADMKAVDVVNHKNEIVTKEECRGFKNKKILYQIRDSLMLMRKGKEEDLDRPNKIIVRPVLYPTKTQSEIFGNLDNLLGSQVSGQNKNKAQALLEINMAKKATISPHYAKNNLSEKTDIIIKESPKLEYICKCIGEHANFDKHSKFIVYLPMGKELFPVIQNYISSHYNMQKSEIAIIDSDANAKDVQKYIKDFKTLDGKVRVILGTSTIKEGLDLQDFTATLFMPMSDWNPTDFKQVVGRLWRHGNNYENIRIVMPLMFDSSDPFAMQKLDTKTKRINDMHYSSSDGEFIDESEINAEDSSLDLIANPDKKAQAFEKYLKKSLENDKKYYTDRKEAIEYYLKEKATAQSNIEYYNKEIEKTEEQIKALEASYPKDEKGQIIVPPRDWKYDNLKNQLKNYKKWLSEQKNKIKKLDKIAEIREYDINGGESVEKLEQKIQSIDKEIENVKDVVEEKKKEFIEQYNKTKESAKGVDELVAEYIKETKKLYGNFDVSTQGKFTKNKQYDIEETQYKNKKQLVEYGEKDIDLQPIFDSISNGIKGAKLAEMLPENIADFVSKFANDYDIVNMTQANSNKVFGAHSGSHKRIALNLAAIGNSPYKFVEVLSHEVEHAFQEKTYQDILHIPQPQWTKEQKAFVDEYKKCKEANKKRRTFYNAHKEIIDRFEKNNFASAKERQQALAKASNYERNIVLKNDKNVLEYLKAQNETSARLRGTENARGFKKQSGFNAGADFGKLRGNNETSEQRTVGTDTRDGITYDQYSTEPTGQISEDKANEKAKNAIRKWYSKIENDRYDVNKTLNSLINITKIYAKDFSKKYKIKVTDKMVREVMPFLRERTGIPDNLNRPELIKFFNALTSADKTKLTKLADETSAKFDKYYQEYKDIKGSLSDSDIENHISHIWKKTEKDLPLLTNYFATSSKYAKNRTIPTIFDGINGITLENGETKYYEPQTLDYAEILKMSSDTFIKANADVVLADLVKKIRGNDGELLVKPYSKAPSNWIEFDHPALAKRVFLGSNNDTITLDKQTVKVHPDIADTLKTVFETYRDSKFMQAYDTLNSAYKQAQLGFSGFHIVALTESMLGNMGIKKTANILNPARVFNEVKNGNWNIYKDDALAHQAIDDGLQFGATLDIDRKTVEKIVDDAADKVGSKIPILGKTLSVISKAQKLNNKILWDYLHNNYKLECYKALCEQEARKRKLTAKDRQEIAQWVNDSFGGQVWELLGISTTGRKTEQRIFLSPDWLRSTTRQFLGMFSNGKIQSLLKDKSEQSNFWKKAKEIGERWGINSLTGDVESSSMRGKIARAFWLRSIIYSAIFYNVFNALMRLWDKEKNPQYYDKNLKLSDLLMYSNSTPTDNAFDKFLPKIFVGRNKDGSERMLRLGKQFREVPELASNPIKKLGGKLSPNVQIASQILTGHTASGFKNKDMFEKDGTTRKNRITSGAKVIAKSFVPYSVNQMLNENSEPSWFSLFAPVSKGMTQGKAKYEFMKIYQNGTPEQIAELEKIMAKNGIDKKTIKKIRKTARTEYKNTYKSEFIAALKADNKNKITEIELKMKKDGFNRSEIRKTLLKAKEDLKKKGK